MQEIIPLQTNGSTQDARFVSGCHINTKEVKSHLIGITLVEDGEAKNKVSALVVIRIDTTTNKNEEMKVDSLLITLYNGIYSSSRDIG